MIVKIGKYKNFFGIYHLADLFQKIGFKEETCENIGDFLGETFLKDFFLWINKKNKRKTFVKIHKYDVWSLDHTLALIILPALKEYKNQMLESPSHPTTDEIKNFNDWLNIINKMIWSFEHIVNDSWQDKYYNWHKTKTWLPKPKRDEKPYDKALIIGFYDEERIDGTPDYKGLETKENEIRKGLELFGKYFTFLWN